MIRPGVTHDLLSVQWFCLGCLKCVAGRSSRPRDELSGSVLWFVQPEADLERHLELDPRVVLTLYADGKGHVEMTALAYIQKNGWEALGGATNRNICAFCENVIRDMGGSLEGSTFPGRVYTINGMFGYLGERMFSP